MVTKEQAILGTVFVSVNPFTGQSDFHYRRRGVRGLPREFRRNGKTRTWKRDPERWELPTKYGFKDCYLITPASAHTFMVIEEYEARQRYGFSPDTPAGIVADRLDDDGEHRAANVVRGIGNSVPV